MALEESLIGRDSPPHPSVVAICPAGSRKVTFSSALGLSVSDFGPWTRASEQNFCKFLSLALS